MYICIINWLISSVFLHSTIVPFLRWFQLKNSMFNLA
jgi:hypothetical protein